MLTTTMQQIVAAEVANDPTGQGYSGKTAAELATLLNASYTVPGPTIPHPPRINEIMNGVPCPNAVAGADVTAALSNAASQTVTTQAQAIIAAEINGDPKGRGYSSQTAAQQAALLNANYSVVGPTITMPSRFTQIMSGQEAAPDSISAADVTAATSIS
jgi:hypothetical protein